MHRKFWFYPLLLLSLSQLPAQAQDCPVKDPGSTEYMQRYNPTRCEGIQVRNINGDTLSLTSFTSGDIDEYDDFLTLQVPRLNGSNRPELRVTSQAKNYSLDKVDLAIRGSLFALTWDTYVLKKEDIPPKSLRAFAYYYIDSQIISAPVILGQSAGRYKFTFTTDGRVKFPVWEILRNGEVVYTHPVDKFSTGEINFTWDGRKAPAGRYELHYIAHHKPRGEEMETIPGSLVFQHNPEWLR